MIKKPLEKPLKVIVCDALSWRISPQNPKYPTIMNEHGTYSSGYQGEKNLQYHLSILPEKGYYIFHGLRLKTSKFYFRIDILIITAKYAFILEVKNYTGELFLDTKLNQLIQKKNNEKVIYPCPILQAQRQQLELQKWLKYHNFSNLPIVYMVVFSNKRVYLETYPGSKEIFEVVGKSPDIINRIDRLDRIFTDEKINEKDLSKLVKLLIKSHHLQSSLELIAEYKIDHSEIQPGAQCTNCGRFAMKYHNHTWICPHCYAHSKTAHEKAIHDYFLLIKPTITNAELRKFLHLSSSRVANRILKQLNLICTGENKARVYHAPREFPYYQ